MFTLSIIGTAFSIIVTSFIFWMLIHCIMYEEDRIERVTWALFIVIVGLLGAPIYFMRCYLPRKREWRNAKQTNVETR